MKARHFAAALALVWAGALGAQSITAQRSAPLLVKYDLDSGTYTFCTQVGSAVLVPKDKVAPITTSGSTTTVTGVNGADDAFDPVGVGSIIYLNIPQDVGSLSVNYGPAERYLTAKASADSVTVDTAIELPTAGVNYAYTVQTCGTAAGSGWFPVGGFASHTLLLEIAQISTTSGIDYVLQCKHGHPWATAVTVIENTAAVTTATTVPLVWSEPYDYCRFGIRLDSTDDGSDTGADAEQIFTTVISRR